MEVKFFLKDKSKDTTSIRAVVRNKGERYQIAVGETVITKFWNDDKYRCRTLRDYPDASHINARLVDWADLIEKAINEFGLITPTQNMVRDKIDEILRNRNIEAGGVIENEEEQYLVAFAEHYRNTSTKTERTKKGYTTTINKLKEFEEAHMLRLRFIDIDIDFYNKFKNWMLQSSYVKSQTKDKDGNVIGDNRLNYTKNYIGVLFKNITLFMNESMCKKTHNFSGFLDKGFKTEREETDSIYLTQDEIQKIYDLKFTREFLIANGYDSRPQSMDRAIHSLNEERDRFLIGCFTSLRHSDYSRLDNIHFRKDIIRIWTVKRDKKVFIPMHFRVKEILERRNNILPAPISDQKHNKQIKVIGKLAGINEDVVLAKIRGGKRYETIKPKYELITSHTARRSGATNMYLAGIDLKFIQDILGHSKIEQTIKYIKVTAEDNAKRLIDHPYFSGNKKHIILD